MIKVFRDPIYETKVTLYYHEPDSKVRKDIEKLKINSPSLSIDLDQTLMSEGAITITPSCRSAIVIIPNHLTLNLGMSYFLSVITHECFHVTYHAMRESGIALTDESEEAFAYYLGWINKMIIRAVLHDIASKVKIETKGRKK